MNSKMLLCGAAALIAAWAGFRPGQARKTSSSEPGLARAGIDPAVASLLQRSCADCHFDQTRWPWYGRVPPASWAMERDVAKARREMNFSRWNEYNLERRAQLLAAIGAAIRNHQMPPARYTLLHPDAKLTPADIAYLYAWTRAQRRTWIRR